MKLFDAAIGHLREALRAEGKAATPNITEFRNRSPLEGTSYCNQFALAERFSSAIGSTLEPLAWLPEPVLRDGSQDLIDRLLREAGVRDSCGGAAQCLKWSTYLRPHVEQAFDIRAVLTVGQLWRNQTPIFDPSWDQLHRFYNDGFALNDFGKAGSGLNFHAWLTLATGEILDFTLLSSLAAVLPDKWGPLAGHVLGGYPQVVFEHHRYVPMVLGDAYAIRVNNNSPVPLLAQCADDLHQLPMFVAAVAKG